MAVEMDEDDSDVDMDVAKSQPVAEKPLVPMPESGGIQALREKLHARMAQLKRGGRWQAGGGEAGSRDELLDERRRQRAAMRERRRKETKEKIRREEEMKGKRGKDKEREKAKGSLTKVRSPLHFLDSLTLAADTTACTRRGLVIQVWTITRHSLGSDECRLLRACWLVW